MLALAPQASHELGDEAITVLKVFPAANGEPRGRPVNRWAEQ